MYRHGVRTALIAVLATAVPAAACDTRPVVYQTAAQPGYAPAPAATQTQTQTSLDPSAFDLQTAVGLLRTNQVRNAQELEAAINDGASGINNVDIDGDGQIDYIGVQETGSPNGRQFAFMACPSSRNGGNVNIASVTFTNVGGQVAVGAGYTSVVVGYDNPAYYYGYRAALSDYVFLTWLYSTRPYYVYRPYGYGYVARPIMGGAVVRQTRTTYQTRTHVAPVARTAPPAGYVQAAKVQSRYAAPAVAPSSGITGRSNAMQDYQARDRARPQSAGSAFGGTSAPAVRPAAPSMPTYRPVAPSAPTYRPSAPAFRPSAPSAPTFRSAPPAPTFRPSAPSAPTFRPSTPSFRPSTPSFRPSTPTFRPSGGSR